MQWARGSSGLGKGVNVVGTQADGTRGGTLQQVCAVVCSAWPPACSGTHNWCACTRMHAQVFAAVDALAAEVQAVLPPPESRYPLRVINTIIDIMYKQKVRRGGGLRKEASTSGAPWGREEGRNLMSMEMGGGVAAWCCAHKLSAACMTPLPKQGFSGNSYDYYADDNSMINRVLSERTGGVGKCARDDGVVLFAAAATPFKAHLVLT